MSRRQFHNSLEERVWRGNIAVHQVFIEGNGVDFARNASLKNRFDLRSKDQSVFIPIIIQWLLSKAVTSSEKASAFSIPESESEHTAQVLHTIITVLFVGMNDGLGVTACTKRMATLL